MRNTPESTRQYKYIDIVTAIFVTVLIVSNITSVKQLVLGPFTFDGGTIIFPLSYIFGDVLTEVYGYARSRRVIWTGFACLLLTVVVFGIVQQLTPAPYWDAQPAYDAILGQTPRIVLASLVAFFVGEFSNSYVLAKMKIATQGKWLWARTIGSTIVGEGVDTLIFALVAFAGTMGNSDLVNLVVSNYIFKVGVEAVFTPITYWVVDFLKRVEHEDYYDRATNFNPFALRS
ncbi:MAG: queuosine precursor transporter [Anaerolineae bacterium]|nr:queuosine precursor transporter [Anaerolineae bacterium]